jgi:hypothetical protein
MFAASSSIKPLRPQYNCDWFLLSLIIFSSFSVGFVFGGDVNKLGAAAVVGGGAFGSK